MYYLGSRAIMEIKEDKVLAFLDPEFQEWRINT